MKEDVVQASYQGVRDAKKKAERDYRDPQDIGLEVARGGAVRLDGEYPDEIDRFPHMVISLEDGLYRAHVPAAVALAWTTPEERALIRERLPEGAHHSSDEVMAMVAELNVWKHAIAEIARTDEDSLTVVDEIPVTSWAGKDVRRHEGVTVEDYKANLHEPYRPPSKGGNTTALHIHRFTLEGKQYSFFARGSKKWIFKSDEASFDYIVTEEGYHNVIPTSVVTKDAKGKVIQCGNRTRKQTLRTAQTRQPGSRREQRD